MEKIISWDFFLEFFKKDKTVYEQKRYLIARLIESVVKDLGCLSLFDTDYCLGQNYFFCKEHNELFKDNTINIDTIRQDDYKYFPIHKNIYNSIYKKQSEINKEYDAIVFTDYKKYFTIEDYMKVLHEKKIVAKKYLFYMPYPYKKENSNKFNIDFSKWGCVRKIAFYHGYIFIIEKKMQEFEIDLQMYIVTHKEFTPPTDEFRKPIQAGQAGGSKLNYMKDDIGENKSYLNPYINEYTAIYWIWKNTSSQYVGIEHYRRYFLNNRIESRENLLNKEHIAMILSRYDIIVVQAMSFYPESVGKSIMLDTDEELYNTTYDIIRNLIKARQPDYIEAYDYVMSGYIFFKCNMFITSKKIMDRYCEWLFSFIIDAVDLVDVKNCSAHNKRIVGFFAERLLTVWLLKEDLHIKELPILEIK